MNVCQCCAVVLHQRTTFQSSQAFNLLSFVALELHFVLARRAMEPGHLLHSALTRPSSANARRLKSRHPFAPVAQQLISSSDDSRSAAIWAYHRWKAEWADNTTILRTFIPDLGTLLEWPCQKQRGSGLTASAPVSDVSALAYTYGVWRPLLRPVNVAQTQRNKLTTMSFTVQTIVLPMDCMAWRLWTMRQSNAFNACPDIYSAAKQLMARTCSKRWRSCGWTKSELEHHVYFDVYRQGRFTSIEKNKSQIYVEWSSIPSQWRLWFQSHREKNEAVAITSPQRHIHLMESARKSKPYHLYQME